MNTESFSPAAEHLVGFLVVMVTLAVLWGMTSVVGRWFAHRDSARPVAQVIGGAPDEDLVVAVAAAAAMIGAPHGVLSVSHQPSRPSVEV